MMPLTFDTHAFVKRLTVAGMPEPQAEAVTAMVNEAREIDLANLATKADIQAIRTDFVRLEQATKADNQSVRSEIAQLAQATKAEFRNQEQSTTAEFKKQEQLTAAEFKSIRAELAQLEHRMTIKLGGLMMAATGLILAAFRVMH